MLRQGFVVDGWKHGVQRAFGSAVSSLNWCIFFLFLVFVLVLFALLVFCF